MTVEEFLRRLGRLFLGMAKSRAHGDVVITFQEGVIKYVKVQRGFLPHDLPEG